MSCYSFVMGLMKLASVSYLNQVQFVNSLISILPPFASANYLLQSISVKLIYQFLYLIYGFLCLEKVSEELRSRNKEGNSRGVTTS